MQDTEDGRFLLALSGSDCGTFVSIRDGLPGRALKEVELGVVRRTLLALNKTGSDIFVAVNKTDAKGRRAENIVGARACWADYDNGVPSEWTLPPSMIVESSPGKAQAYWLLLDAELPADERWLAANRGIAAATGADLNACDSARILRLPGYVNHKYAEKPEVRLLHCNNVRYRLAEIERTWKPLAPVHMQMAAGGRLGVGELPEEDVRQRRYEAWLRAAGQPPQAGAGVRSWIFRKAAMGVRDFALSPRQVADCLAEATRILDYDLCYKFALDAERYASGERGQGLATKEARVIEMR